MFINKNVTLLLDWFTASPYYIFGILDAGGTNLAAGDSDDGLSYRNRKIKK